MLQRPRALLHRRAPSISAASESMDIALEKIRLAERELVR